MASVSFGPAVHANYLSAIGRELGLDGRGTSVYLSLNFWGALAAVVVAGPLAGCAGSRKLLLTACALETAGLLLAALAPSALPAYAGVLLTSLSYGTVSVLVPHLVSGLFGDRRDRAVSLLVSFYTIGAIVGNALVLVLMALAASWRVGYVAVALLCPPWGVLLAVSGADAPRQGAPVERQEAPVLSRSTSRSTWSRLVFAFVCLAGLLASAAEVSTSMWVPTFLTRELGAAASVGPLALLLFCGVSAAGKLVNAAATGRVDFRIPVAVGLALFSAGIVTVFRSATVGVAMAGFGLVGLGVSGIGPAVLTRLAELFPGASAARYSFYMAAANAGPVAGPLLVGMAAGGDLRHGMLTMLPAAAAACLMLALTREPSPRRG